MIDLEAYGGIGRTLGVFPNVTAINSAGDANDGTPFMAAMVDDIWGFFQACLNECGYTPSGDNESSIESQILKALKNVCGGPGELIYYMGNIGMFNLGDKKLLPLMGQVVLVADYLELVDEVWDSYENETTEGFYRSTDSGGITRNVSGTYLHIPNYQGVFVRGWDSIGYHDPDYGRLVHSLQVDALQEHKHYISSPLMPSSYYARQLSFTGTSGEDPYLAIVEEPLSEYRAVADESPTGNVIEEETRPTNRCAIACVRF